MSALIAKYSALIDKYGIVGIQQPFASEKLDCYVKLKAATKDVLLFMEDSFITNRRLREEAVQMNAVSGAVLRLDKIGTVTEAISAAQLCCEYGLIVAVAVGPA